MEILPNGYIPITEENFPDPIFRDYIKKYVANNAKSLTPKKIRECKDMHLCAAAFRKIESFSGIEFFYNLTEFEWSSSSYAYLYKEVDKNEERRKAPDLSALFKVKSLKSLALVNVTIDKTQQNENGVSFMDFSSLENLETLYLSWIQVKKLGIEKLHNLKVLKCNNSLLDEIDLNSNTNLEQVDFSLNPLRKISLDKLSKLKYLGLTKTKIETLDLRNHKKLERIILANCDSLLELQLPEKGNLKEVDISDAKLSTIQDFAGMLYLERIRFHNTALTKCHVKSCPSLDSISVQNNQLEELEVEDCESLKVINSSNNHIKEPKLKNLPDLKCLDVACNQISKIDIQEFDKLTDFSMYNNPFREILFSKKQEKSFFSENET